MGGHARGLRERIEAAQPQPRPRCTCHLHAIAEAGMWGSIYPPPDCLIHDRAAR
jgi:hypothetical protein